MDKKHLWPNLEAGAQTSSRAPACPHKQNTAMRRSGRQPRGGNASTADSLPPHGTRARDPSNSITRRRVKSNRRKQTNNRRCTLFLDPQPPVADGLRAFVRSCPSHVAAMVDASPGVASNTDALTDKLAGVMAVNSLSAESMLARFVYFYFQLLFPSVWAIVLTSCFV